MSSLGQPSIPWSFGGLNAQESDPSLSQIVVIPVPYDSTTSFRGGSREGPNAILNASRYLEDFDIELGKETYLVGIHTTEEVEPHVGSPEQMMERVYGAVYPWASLGKIVSVLGGEHSISIGSVRALAEIYPDLSVLYIDAHADMRDEYMGSKYSHACTARRIMEICPLVPLGVRSMSKEEMDFVTSNNLKVHFGGEMNSSNNWDMESILSSLSEKVYISLDLDAMDLSLISGVGNPEPGGIDWNNMLGIIKAVSSEKRIVGFDLTELSPIDGSVASSFVAAKLAYKIMGYATP
ncbi:MAG: agmatinase [Dehalococcoidia bacterium]|nr:agmatinase [Dehalococcoidia bacterium]